MKLLFIGDVIGRIGRETVRRILPEFKRREGIDAVIANGENSSNANGISQNSAEDLFTSGVDVITTGNHVFRRRDAYDYLDSDTPVVRPANLYSGAPGKGAFLLDMGRFQLYVINLIGRSYMEPNDNPFLCADKLLQEAPCKMIFVDFHAEATAEKICMGQYLDGKVSAVIGTHTHVQTADEMILPGGTGYLTDAGMVGPIHSVIGVKSDIAVPKMVSGMPARFEYADGPCQFCAVKLSLDPQTGKTTQIDRIFLK